MWRWIHKTLGGTSLLTVLIPEIPTSNTTQSNVPGLFACIAVKNFKQQRLTAPLIHGRSTWILKPPWSPLKSPTVTGIEQTEGHASCTLLYTQVRLPTYKRLFFWGKEKSGKPWHKQNKNSCLLQGRHSCLLSHKLRRSSGNDINSK